MHRVEKFDAIQAFNLIFNLQKLCPKHLRFVYHAKKLLLKHLEHIIDLQVLKKKKKSSTKKKAQALVTTHLPITIICKIQKFQFDCFKTVC